MPTGFPVISSDGTEVVALDFDGIAHIWNAFTLEESDTLEVGGVLGGPAWVEAVGPDWLLVRRFEDEMFVALDRSSLAAVAEFEFDLLLNIEISTDGSFLLMRHFDTTIHRVDTHEWKPRLLASPGQFVRGLALSPEGDRLMLGGTEGFVRIIDARDGALVDQVPLGHVSDGHWIDEQHIAVGTGQGGTWGVITLDFGEVIEQARAQLTRTFTDDECRIYRIDPCPTLEEIRSEGT